MPNEKIKSALKKLHSELSDQKIDARTNDALCNADQASGEDTELNELLKTLASDIEDYLKSSKTVEPNKHGVAHRLEEIATDFSVEHPKLDIALQEIRKILLGIGA